jgi:glycosyltransferase involved in cell wall biosynthesis
LSEKRPLRILFVTRKFPPMKGGMERVAKDLYDSLSRNAIVNLVKPGIDSRNPVMVLLLFIKSFIEIRRTNSDLMYLQDGMLGPLVILGRFFNIPVAIQIHGLDIIYDKLGYQRAVVPFIRLADRIIAVSHNTKRECEKRGVNQEAIEVIPNGFNPVSWNSETEEPEDSLEVSLLKSDYMLSVGRLIERKGFHWFIKEVMPLILYEMPEIKYYIVGTGHMEDTIKKEIAERGLENHVHLLGSVESSVLLKLYKHAKLLLSPNIRVQGDLEGFGVVNIEAAYFGVPVIASNVDGVPDAVIDGETGKLVAEGNAKAYAEAVLESWKSPWRLKKEQMREIVLQYFNWDPIAQRYLNVFESMLVRNS